MVTVIGIAGNSSAGKDTVANLLVERGFTIVSFADELKRLAGRIFDYDANTLFGEPACRNAPDPRASDPAYWKGVWDRVDVNQGRLVKLFRDAPIPISECRITRTFTEMVLEFLHRREGMTARRCLQQMGTAWGRALWSDVWINTVRNTVQHLEQGWSYTRQGGPVDPDTWGTDPHVHVCISDSRFANEAQAVRSLKGGKMIWLEASLRAPRNPSIAHDSEPVRESFIVNGVDLIDYDLDNNGTLESLPGKLDLALIALAEGLS